MIRARITIDLPSAETDRPLNPGEWIKALFGGRVDARTGYEELTVSAWSLLQGMREGFAAAGITDAVSLLVDGTPVYADAEAVPDDLDLLVRVAQQSGLLERPFQELNLVLQTRRCELHVLFDVAVHRTVLLGQSELAIQISARPEAMAARAGDTREAWAARVESWSDRATLGSAILAFDGFVADLAAELATLLKGAAVSAGPTNVAIALPGEIECARLAKLPFGDAIRGASWHPVPGGAHDPDADPFDVYLLDPYWPLACHLLDESWQRDPDARHPLISQVDGPR